MTQPAASALPPSPVELTVESLGGLGDGIATLNGQPVFIPKSCVGDRLRVSLLRRNHDGLHGRIDAVLAPGPGRSDAPCPYFSRCGGCALQQLSTADYQAFKTRMLRSALASAGYARPEAAVHFLPPGLRRRVEFSVHHNDGRLALAFHEPRSHRLTAIDNCLVLEPALQEIMAPLAEALSNIPGIDALRSVSLTAADSGIDLMLTLTAAIELSPLPPLCERLGIARASIRLPQAAPRIVCERAPVEMQLGDYAVPLPPDAFLQATRQGQRLLTDFVLHAVASAAAVADLFCGIGSYSLPLAANLRVHAVESDAAMVQAMQQAIRRHRLTTLTAERRDLFKQPLTAAELQRFDAVIVNPPRAGAKAQCEQLAQSNVRRVVMISCNPASFARDARILKNAGFSLERAHGIDQFVWSPFLEIAAVFTR